MACLINAKSTGVGGIDASGDASGVLALQTGGTTAVTIDASQNVGIGTTSPTDKFVVASGSNLISLTTDGNIEILRNGGGAYIDLKGAAVDYDCRIQSSGNGATASLAFSVNGAVRTTIDYTGKLTNVGTSGGVQASIGTSSDAWTFNTYNSGASYITLGGSTVTQGSIGTSSNIPLTLLTNNTERMRINANGNVLINSTTLKSGEYLNITYNGASGVPVQSGIAFNDTYAGGGSTTACIFYKGGTAVGSISVNGSTTTYSTSSDYRLKENVAPMAGALDKVALLKPVTYTWKSYDTNGQGFIAHELQEVVPDCVTGEKDAVDADGNPVYQGIDTSFLVATLTAAIQELKAIIDTQQTRITALEAK